MCWPDWYENRCVLCRDASCFSVVANTPDETIVNCDAGTAAAAASLAPGDISVGKGKSSKKRGRPTGEPSAVASEVASSQEVIDVDGEGEATDAEKAAGGPSKRPLQSPPAATQAAPGPAKPELTSPVKSAPVGTLYCGFTCHSQCRRFFHSVLVCTHWQAAPLQLRESRQMCHHPRRLTLTISWLPRWQRWQNAIVT